MVNMKKIALFAAGTLFGSAGFKLLSSSDAKKVLHPDYRCCPAHEGLHHGDCEQGSGTGR